MVRSSGPAAREFPLYFIACETISRNKRDTELSSGHFLWSFRLTICLTVKQDNNKMENSPKKCADITNKIFGSVFTPGTYETNDISEIVNISGVMPDVMPD